MAFKSKDGKREFSMSSQKSIYDRGHKMNDSMGDKMSGKTDVLAPPEGDEGMDDNADPHQVAEEHGPAEAVHVMHGDEHSVESEHPDGHKHHSKHESAGEAHDTGKCLAGACDHGGESEGMGESEQAGDEGM